jgi:2,3-bisphosphoglycerate-independent phosphoglycerate mutase
MTKALIIVLDGLGDRPIKKFNGKTPLEHANTPFFDQLLSKGLCGQVDPLKPGIPVSTHTGMALLMGLATKDVASLSRGPVEAYGIDLDLQAGDIVLRCNFAHIENSHGEGLSGLKVIDRRAGRINQQTEVLAQAINHIDLPYGIKAKVFPTTQHRAVLHLSGDNLSANISDTDCSRVKPAFVQQCKALLGKEVDKGASINTAEVINYFTSQAYLILDKHPINQQRISQGKTPANGIICRSAGKITSINNVLNYYNVKTAVVSGESTVLGLAKKFGFTAITRPEFTSLIDTDLDKKIQLSLDALEDHDLVYLHIKGTDICAHDHQADLKTKFIEKIDTVLANLVGKKLLDNNIFAVTADHSTDTNTGFHSGDPVPSIIYSPYGRIDKCQTFSELECMSGGLNRLSASSFLLSILDQMDCLHNFKKSDNKVL